jgi:hypothetical protein
MSEYKKRIAGADYQYYQIICSDLMEADIVLDELDTATTTTITTSAYIKYLKSGVNVSLLKTETPTLPGLPAKKAYPTLRNNATSSTSFSTTCFHPNRSQPLPITLSYSISG